MFGRRPGSDAANPRAVAPAAAPPVATPQSAAAVEAAPAQPAPEMLAEVQQPEAPARSQQRSEEYYDVKTTVFNALIDTIDLTQLAKLDAAAARESV